MSLRRRLNEPRTIPTWWLVVFVLVSFFNAFIFVVIALYAVRPPAVPTVLTTDVVLGLHLQMFEAIIAALGIGLAVFGFVGYSTFREAAERRAELAAREVVQTYLERERPDRATSNEPDLSGRPTNNAQRTPEGEEL